jgi:hypothetical protein
MAAFMLTPTPTCLRPRDDWLLEPPMFAVWESESHAPGLIANTFIGCRPGHPALASIVRATARMNDPIWQRTWRIENWRGIRPRFRYEKTYTWKTVGPQFFTKMVLPFCPPAGDEFTVRSVPASASHRGLWCNLPDALPFSPPVSCRR